MQTNTKNTNTNKHKKRKKDRYIDILENKSNNFNHCLYVSVFDLISAICHYKNDAY